MPRNKSPEHENKNCRPVSISLPPSLHDDMRAEAKLNGITLSALVQEILLEYLKTKK